MRILGTYCSHCFCIYPTLLTNQAPFGPQGWGQGCKAKERSSPLVIKPLSCWVQTTTWKTNLYIHSANVYWAPNVYQVLWILWTSPIWILSLQNLWSSRPWPLALVETKTIVRNGFLSWRKKKSSHNQIRYYRTLSQFLLSPWSFDGRAQTSGVRVGLGV